MAVAHGTTFVAPSTDVKTETELNSTKIESGLFYCNKSKTITAGSVSVTSDMWAVTCISNTDATNLHCFMQMWVPVQSSVGTKVTAFVRYSANGSTSYGVFRALLNDTQAIQNPAGGDVRIVMDNSQPAAIANVTQIWIDTSGS